MQKHQTSRLFRVDELTPEKLIFKLTPEQRKRVPKGLKLYFHKSTQPYKNKGYKHLCSRAEYYFYDTTGKQRKATAGTQLIGIIWDDDPEWVYETDQTKSSIKERRKVACENKLAPSRLTERAMSTVFEELIGYEEDAVIAKKVPIQIFMMVALICALQGTTDATSVADYWNNNIKFLRKIYPELTFHEISHDSVTRLYSSMTDEAVQKMLTMSYRWSRGLAPSEGRHFAMDGQTCRSSCRYTDTPEKDGEVYDCVGLPLMIFNAVDVSAGKCCASHCMISTENSEQKLAPQLLTHFDIHGATVTLDVLDSTLETAQSIIAGGGFYLLAVKNNQPNLLKAITKLIENSEKTEINKGVKRAHDREDRRIYTVAPAKALPEEFLQKWPGLHEGCVIKAVTRTCRRTKGGVWTHSDETRWFITCHPYGDGSIAPWLAQCIRGHWGVESFHWTMDMVWGQDRMQCQHPIYLRTRETFAQMAHDLLKTIQLIDKKERGLTQPRSLTQLTHEVGASLETGLSWLQKLAFCKDPTALVR